MRRVLTLLIVVVALAFVWSLAGEAALLGLSAWLDVGAEPARTEYVLVLSGDVNYRPPVAAQLVSQGFCQKVLLTNEPLRPEDAEDLVIRDRQIAPTILSRLGVPADAITVLPREVTNTFDEAVAIQSLMDDQRDARVTVVTSWFHTRRARWVFRQVIGSEADRLHFVFAPTNGFSKEDWWRDDRGFRYVLSEYLGIATYAVRFSWFWRIAVAGFVGLVVVGVAYRWWRRGATARRMSRIGQQGHVGEAGALQPSSASSCSLAPVPRGEGQGGPTKSRILDGDLLRRWCVGFVPLSKKSHAKAQRRKEGSRDLCAFAPLRAFLLAFGPCWLRSIRGNGLLLRRTDRTRAEQLLVTELRPLLTAQGQGEGEVTRVASTLALSRQREREQAEGEQERGQCDLREGVPSASSRVSRLAWPLAITLFAGVLLCFHVPILQCVAYILIVDDQPPHADYVVVSSGDGIQPAGSAAVLSAAQFVRTGRAQRILVTSRRTPPAVQLGAIASFSDRCRDVLVKRSVPTEAIETLQTNAQNWPAEVRAIGSWLEAHSDVHVLLTCSQFDSRAWRWMIDRELDERAAARIALLPLRDRDFDETNWWRSYRGIKSFVMDGIKLVHTGMGFLTETQRERPETGGWRPDGGWQNALGAGLLTPPSWRPATAPSEINHGRTEAGDRRLDNKHRPFRLLRVLRQLCVSVRSSVRERIPPVNVDLWSLD
jgi:uncharacterized SAM-binding protein YcdF (DUF218 family)